MEQTGERKGRIAALDIARTIALIGMAVYHFCYDLEMFGFVAPGTAVTGVWFYLARIVAGSFLFLAGVSLWLAHGERLRWRAFARRIAMIAAGALLISVATRYAFPDRFIYFGILHSIAAASLIGLLFLRVPAIVTLGAAAFVFALDQVPLSTLFDAPLLWPLGLSANAQRAVDFVPLIPWLGPFLAGIALAKLAGRAGLWAPLRAAISDRPLTRALGWPGRHGLMVYLTHQPILIAVVWSLAQILR